MNYSLQRVYVTDSEESNRELDINGYLHIKNCVLTKEGVADYLGSDIPEWNTIGLNPDNIYKVYRSKEILEENVNTFNNMPITLEHPENMDSESFKDVPVYGTTGEQSRVEDGVLYNNIVIYDKDVIDSILNGTLKELSCGYFWDVIPSEKENVDFDIIAIKGNHLAIVKQARIDGACIADSAHTTGKIKKGVLPSMGIINNLFPSKGKDSAHEGFNEFKEELATLLSKYQLEDKAESIIQQMEGDSNEEQDSCIENDEELEEKEIGSEELSEGLELEEKADDFYTKDEVNRLLEELKEELAENAKEHDEALEEAGDILGDVECKTGDSRSIRRMILDAKGIDNSKMNDAEVKGAVRALRSLSSTYKYKTSTVINDSNVSDFSQDFLNKYRGGK